MSDPAQRVEATPREIFYLPRQGYAGQQPAVWLDDWRRILQRAETAERAFTLAQTENAGHIRIEDELKAALREAEALCAELGKDLKDAMDALRNQA